MISNRFICNLLTHKTIALLIFKKKVAKIQKVGIQKSIPQKKQVVFLTFKMPFLIFMSFIISQLHHKIINIMYPSMDPINRNNNTLANPMSMHNHQPVSPAIPCLKDLPELSYLEYCIMPSLFSDHELISKSDYKTLANTFHMYAQILLEFSETNISNGIINLNGGNTLNAGFGGISWEQSPTSVVIEIINTGSAVTCQLFKLLKMIFKKIPIQQLDGFYDGSIPYYLYRVLIADIVQQQQAEQQQYYGADDGYYSQSSYNQPSVPLLFQSGGVGNIFNSNSHNPNPNFQHSTQYILYLSSLQYYYWMLEQNLAIKGHLTYASAPNNFYKLSDQILKNKYEQLSHYKKNIYEAELEAMFYGDQIYGAYCSMFKRLLMKLLYVLERPINSNDAKNQTANNLQLNIQMMGEEKILLRRKSSNRNGQVPIDKNFSHKHNSFINMQNQKMNEQPKQSPYKQSFNLKLNSYYLQIKQIYNSSQSKITNCKSPFSGNFNEFVQKYKLIRNLYKQFLTENDRKLKNSKQPSNKIQELEKTLLLLLEQISNSQLLNNKTINQNKLDCYILVVCLKCMRRKIKERKIQQYDRDEEGQQFTEEREVSWIKQLHSQIKLLISCAAEDQLNLDLQAILLLAYTLLNCLPQSININNRSSVLNPSSAKYCSLLKQILQILLKVSTPTNATTQYVKLVILISLMYRMLSTNKNSNWKQLLDKMVEHPDIIDPITNSTVLDYLLGLLTISNQLRIFDLQIGNNSKKEDMNSYVFRIMNDEIVDRKELSKQIKSYYTYLSVEQQLPQSASSTNNIKLLKLIQKIVQNKNTILQYSELLASNDNSMLEKYLQNRLLSYLLILSSYSRHLHLENIKYLLQILNQYFALPACIQYIPSHTVVKYMLGLLYLELLKDERFLDASICFSLLIQSNGGIAKKESYLAMQKAIKSKPQLFWLQDNHSHIKMQGKNKNIQRKPEKVSYPNQQQSSFQSLEDDISNAEDISNMYQCINGFDLLQILIENAAPNNREYMYKVGEEWAVQDENYNYVYDTARKQRGLYLKRAKFVRILFQKFCSRFDSSQFEGTNQKDMKFADNE